MSTHDAPVTSRIRIPPEADPASNPGPVTPQRVRLDLLW
jgi:hypothetical protein